MSANVKYCPECAKNRKSLAPEDQQDFYAGYTVCFFQEKLSNECPMCGKKTLQETNLTEEELDVIGKASNYNKSLIKPMMELKNKDIIEYELKMSQFRGNASQIKEDKKPAETVTLNLRTGKITETPQPSVPRCPKCGSTAIEAVSRGYSFFTGFFGSGKTMNYCKSCGFKYDPKKY